VVKQSFKVFFNHRDHTDTAPHRENLKRLERPNTK